MYLLYTHFYAYLIIILIVRHFPHPHVLCNCMDRWKTKNKLKVTSSEATYDNITKVKLVWKERSWVFAQNGSQYHCKRYRTETVLRLPTVMCGA
jgi:hypothetical protein